MTGLALFTGNLCVTLYIASCGAPWWVITGCLAMDAYILREALLALRTER